MASPLRAPEAALPHTAAEIGAHVDELAAREAELCAALARASPSREQLAELERLRFEITAYLELLEALEDTSAAG